MEEFMSKEKSAKRIGTPKEIESIDTIINMLSSPNPDSFGFYLDMNPGIDLNVFGSKGKTVLEELLEVEKRESVSLKEIKGLLIARGEMDPEAIALQVESLPYSAIVAGTEAPIETPTIANDMPKKIEDFEVKNVQQLLVQIGTNPLELERDNPTIKEICHAIGIGDKGTVEHIINEYLNSPAYSLARNILAQEAMQKEQYEIANSLLQDNYATTAVGEVHVDNEGIID
jgi:hypothetical protein